MDQKRQKLLSSLAKKIGHAYDDLNLLQNALRHSSYANEHPLEEEESNERLEFLGDAVLQLCVTRMLYERFPQATEGQLSKARASLVNENRLAALARRLKLGDCLLLGRGEKVQNGQEKSGILADAMEAVLASVYLDGGLALVDGILRRLLGPAVARSIKRSTQKDHKTKLQELIQEKMHITPCYQVLDAQGPDHAKTFRVVLLVDGRSLAEGKGKSKKEAEQNAAKSALEKWGTEDGL